MSFSTLINNATASMNTASRTAVRDAFTDFQTALEVELVAYGLGEAEREHIQERLAAFGRDLSAAMRTNDSTVSGSLLTEDNHVLLAEDGTPILLEA